MASDPTRQHGTLPPEIRSAAASGWRLLPVCARGKAPTLKNWRKLATSDLAQLESWAVEFPGCNWGVATGAASGLLVIDIDGLEGRASLESLERQGFILPSTLAVTTGRADGGEHRYFRIPSGLDLRNDQTGKMGRHIDVRATGGLAVHPPSIHANGKQYRFVDPNAKLADLPAWVIERLMVREPKLNAAAQVSQFEGANPIGPGQREPVLFSIACKLRSQGVPMDAIFKSLLGVNASFEVPHTVERVREIAAKSQRYPAGARSVDAALREETGRPKFSDDALALKFTAEHGNNLCYTSATGRWCIWNGKVWEPDVTDYVLHLARNVCREEASNCESDRLASRVASASTVAAVERLARADRRHAATIDQWDADLWLLNTPTGVVDLHTGAVRPARREDYLTKTTAVAPGGDCHLWLSFLSRITDGDQELQQFLQRMCGYALTGVTREHALFFLYGTGANGKSVFLNTISGVMGNYARTAPVEAFIASTSAHHPTDLAGLRGARLVTAVETEEGRHWAESKLKALTGGDRIAARFMRQDFFEYLPQFKLIIAGNHKPGLRSVDEAMRRRFNLLPFTTTIPTCERDNKLTEKLRKEWPGILRWMIDGCLSWQSGGLQPPKVVIEATESYLAGEDALSRWIEDRCEVKSTHSTSATVLFQDWRKWCEQNQEHAGSLKAFSQNLESRPFAKKKTNKGREFIGIGLVTDVTGR
jgi:putative DNA primase/helicase